MVTVKAIVSPTVAPQKWPTFVDEKGNLTHASSQFLQQHYNQTAGANRLFATNSASTGNHFQLTMQVPRQTVYKAYATNDTFGFVAPSSSTGPVTASIITNDGSLEQMPVYKTNGAAQATSGDVQENLHYLLTYVDSLNNGAGGFVIR